MKISILGKNTYGTTGFNSEGGILAGPLYLAGAPVNPLEASSKNYVDLSKKSLNAGNITTGILSVNRLPGFNGEFTSIAGSNVLTLGTTGVISGTYTKVTVDSKGRITDAGSLVESDIPNLDWNKVTTGIPTTLDGYGIVDGVKTTGDTMSGALILNAAPTNDYHLATKSYVDGLVGEDSHILKTGDIVRRPSDITPSGFLRCNGGQVSTQVYSALFTVIGYSAVSSMSTYGNGKPWNLQYDINTTQVNDITGWATNGVLPIAVTNASFAVTKNYVYLMGGKSVTGGSKLVYRAPVNANGSFGTWVDTRTVESINLTGDDSKTIPLGTTSVLITGKGGDGGSLANVNLTGSGSGSVAAGPSTITVTGKGGNGTYTLAKFYDTNATNPLGETIVPPISISAPTPPVDITVSVNGTNYTYRSLNNVGVYTNQPWVDGAYAGITYVMLEGQGIPNYTNYMITYLTYLSSKPTTGSSTTITVNGETFTFPGGYGGPASQSQQTKTVSSSSATSYSYNIASGGLGGLTYNTLQNVSTNLSSSGTGTIPSGVTSVAITGKGGDALSSGIRYGSGQPWKNQYDINTNINENLLWGVASGLPGILSESSVVVTKNRVYMIGGRTASVSLKTVYTAPINADGTLGTWVEGTSLPFPISKAQTVVTKNRVYLIGGYENGAFQHSATVYTAPINSDGTLGSWVYANSLPNSCSYSAAIVTKNRIYMLGGYVPSKVYTCSVDSEGIIGSWSETTPLPAAVMDSQAIVTKDRVYLLSGTIYTASINSDGALGSWSNVGNLPGNYQNSQAVVIKNKVYLIGGSDQTGWSNKVYSANIDFNGVLGNWSLDSTLIVPTGASQAIVTSSYIYVISQENGNGHDNTIVRASLLGGLNDYSPYYNGTITNIYTTGTSTNVTMNGTTYTFPGGTTGPATQSVQTATLPGTSSVNYTYSVPDTGSAKLDYQVVGANNGANTTVTIDGTTYTFNGGVNGPATQSTQNVTLTPEQITNISYSVPFNGSANITYIDNENSQVMGKVLPTPLSNSNSVVTKNRIYLVGGYNTESVNSVFTAPIDATGVIDQWASAVSLPEKISDAHVFITKNKLYVVGGYNDISRLNTVYSSTLNADGTISSWVQENNLPFTISNGQAIVTKNAVYLLGGIVNGSVSSSIYISPMAIDGSLPGWTFYGELPIQVRSGQVFVSKNKVYLIAGKNATSDVNIVYMATINTDGSLGTWTQGTSLSSTVTDSTAVVTANKLNIMGGKIAGSTTATILTASISGGLNDYSSYYDGTYTPLTPTTFAIPDTTSEDIGGIYSFIKT